jgi:UDP-GlcNAc3NAcA epimerase
MKVATIVGARPQFIKSAPVSRALQQAGISETVIHTGQHYDSSMSATFFEELDLAEPDHHLGIGSGPHGEQTGRMLKAIEAVLLAEEPEWVLVYGDTNSTLAGALAAAKLCIPIAHVEAGARSFNRRMPEEINRVVTDHLSALLFAASETAVANLRREGMSEQAILFVGDVMLDAVLLFSSSAEGRGDTLGKLDLKSGAYVLATVHRAENTDAPTRLRTIFQGLTDLTSDIRVVLPLHPRTRGALDEATRQAFIGRGGLLIDPASYFDMMTLERHAAVIITDSGGVQKEAFFHQVPCLTLRDETEWPELVKLGWNTLLPPTDAVRIRETVLAIRGRKGMTAAPYGHGHAANDIARAILERQQQQFRMT